jgi:hypothetical protein
MDRRIFNKTLFLVARTNNKFLMNEYILRDRLTTMFLLKIIYFWTKD